MFQIEIKVNSIEKDNLDKTALLLKQTGIEFAFLDYNQNEGTWIVGFNSEQSHQQSIEILTKSDHITILKQNAIDDTNNDYEIIYAQNDIDSLQYNQDTKKQYSQEGDTLQDVLKFPNNLQNLTNISEKNKRQEVEEKNKGEGDSQDERNEKKEGEENQNQLKDKIGSSHTVESIISNEYLTDVHQRFGDTLEATINQSPLISEEEGEEEEEQQSTHQLLYQNISKISTSKEQGSESIKEIKKNWIQEEEVKKQDLFNNNVLYNRKFKLLAFGLFTFYMFFL